MKEKINEALRYIMVTDNEVGDPPIPKVVIYSNTPQWVCDLLNNGCNENGILDQRRQLFIVDSLKLLNKNHIPRYNNDIDDLFNWSKSSKYRRKYINKVKNKYTGSDILKNAEFLEREEIFNYVKTTIKSHV